MTYETWLWQEKNRRESAPISTLSFAISSGPDKSEPFLDFIINGISVREHLCLPASQSTYGVLGGWEHAESSTALLGTGPSFWEQPRIGLYHTCFCGDPLCGMYTAERIDEGNTVLWTNFAYEPRYRELTWEDYLNVPPIRFDAKQYQAVIHTSRELSD